MLLDKQYKEFVDNEIKDTIDDTLEEWLPKVTEWAFHPIRNGERLVAVVMVNKNEIHVAIDQTYKGRWYKREHCSKIFEDILNEYGNVMTSVTWGNEEGMKFVERLGFMPRATTCTLEKINHAR